MAFNQNEAFEVPQGFLVEGGAGIFSGSASPIGSDAPLGSLYLQADKTLWIKNQAGTSGWQIIRHPFGWSQAITQTSGIVSAVEFFTSSSQVTANRRARVAMSYTGDLPTTETWTFYDPADGTTVLRTVTKTYTWSGSDLQTVTEV